mmetsp:Transcript_40598/g.114873  ORF Transcript_40598/g.114873 Transcript_40598/m.114873 type:complete len:263 (-) Transcript_40598:42-830(-)
MLSAGQACWRCGRSGRQEPRADHSARKEPPRHAEWRPFGPRRCPERGGEGHDDSGCSKHPCWHSHPPGGFGAASRSVAALFAEAEHADLSCGKAAASAAAFVSGRERICGDCLEAAESEADLAGGAPQQGGRIGCLQHDVAAIGDLQTERGELRAGRHLGDLAGRRKRRLLAGEHDPPCILRQARLAGQRCQEHLRPGSRRRPRLPGFVWVAFRPQSLGRCELDGGVAGAFVAPRRQRQGEAFLAQSATLAHARRARLAPEK